MNKQIFLEQLYHLLKDLPKAERQQHIDYYTEMIDDRVEDGLSEEEAVTALGSTADIAAQILGDMPAKPVRRFPAWMIALLVLGSPLWIVLILSAATVAVSLAVSLAAVYIALIVTLWATLAALYTADLGFLIGFLGGVTGGVFYLIQGITAPGIALLGGGLVCAGCTVLLFFLSNLLTRLLWRLTKWSALKIVGIFRRKGDKK